MILTGQLDSPFVRRVAIALHHYGLPFERNALSAYDDFDALLALNPLGKVPALELEDGSVLADSALILDYLDHHVGPQKALLPEVAALRAHLLCHMGIAIGLAEKAVEFRTETVRRPEAKRDGPRVARIQAQIAAALAWLETHTPETHTPERGYLAGERLTHSDIASSVAMTFIFNKNPEHLGDERCFPRLRAHTARCEALDAFALAPFKEG